jgi:integrase
MRYSELMSLRPQDIEFNGIIAVIKAGRSVIVEVGGKPVHREYGKTNNAGRDIRVSADLGRKMLHGARDGWIFRAQRGGYLCRSNFRSNWKRACAAVGLPALRVHDARHSHASWLANDRRHRWRTSVTDSDILPWRSPAGTSTSCNPIPIRAWPHWNAAWLPCCCGR